MASDNPLKKIESQSNNKHIALLAQELGFLSSQFSEFKADTGRNFDQLKSNTSGFYAPVAVTNDHERRISKLEGYLMKFLLGIATVIGLALLGLVLKP